MGIIMGITCGLIVAFVAFFWHGNLYLSLVVAVAMIIAITIATSMGTLAPAFFRKMKIDPAVASGPFVTTANDITGILIYLGVATILLKLLV